MQLARVSWSSAHYKAAEKQELPNGVFSNFE